MTRRIAFALASGNTDAHLQNWSLQLPQSGGFRLAPLYDQVSVIALPRWGWDRDRGPGLALPLGGVRRMAEVTEAVVGRFARESGDPSLASAFMDALETASRAWPQVVASALAPHRRAVEEHWKRVPVLAGVGLGAS